MFGTESSSDQPCRAGLVVEQCWHAVPGGTAGATIDLLRAFAGRPDVVATGIAARHKDAPEPAYRVPVDVHHLPFPRQLLYQAWSRGPWPPLDRFVRDVDVVHATGGIVPSTKKPLVVTQHDLAWVHHRDLFTSHGVRFFERCFQRTIERAQLTLVPSQATADDVERSGVDSRSIRVIPWGVDQAKAPPNEVEQVKVRFALPGRYVLSVGTLEPRKNLGRLIEAFSASAPPDVTLAIVGPTGWQEDIATAIAPLGDRAKMLGFVSRSDLVALYGGASAFAYPSLFEGFGLPVLEAMAQGAPVITSLGTATEELVAGGGGVGVDPTNVDAIANALSDVLAGGADVNAMVREASRRAATYTWKRTADLTLSAYAELL